MTSSGTRHAARATRHAVSVQAPGVRIPAFGLVRERRALLMAGVRVFAPCALGVVLLVVVALARPVGAQSPLDLARYRIVDLTLAFDEIVALPMKIAGGSGGPLRAIALVPK
jgi:hypothetical protein